VEGYSEFKSVKHFHGHVAGNVISRLRSQSSRSRSRDLKHWIHQN